MMHHILVLFVVVAVGTNAILPDTNDRFVDSENRLCNLDVAKSR